jgi:glycosyltransferase involved in cell wall biosynthesis
VYDAVIQDELVHPSLFLHNRGGGGAPRGRVVLALVHNLRSGQPGEALAALKARVERRYLATVDGVLAVCARTLDDVRALAGRDVPGQVIPPGRDHVSPDVGEPFVDERSAEAGPLRVLHAAAVRPHKGLHRLLDALAAAPGLAFTLDVVGSVAARRHVRAVERQAARLGLAARVRLHGERTGPALAALFRRAHVLALPSDREAYSLACLEGLGFGLPVLATSRGGLGEMIAHGREGFLLDPHDAAAWAGALAALDRDRAALAAMSRAALARYRAHATWEAAGAAVTRFIQARLAHRAADASQ